MSENQLPVLSMPVDIDMDVDKGNMLLRLYTAAAAFQAGSYFPIPQGPSVAPQPAAPAIPGGAPPAPAVPDGKFNPPAAPKPGDEKKGEPKKGTALTILDGTLAAVGQSFKALGKALTSTLHALSRVFSTAVKWSLGISALAAGSLFGYDKLAQHVSSGFTASRGLNISTGFATAVHNVWGNKLTDSEGLLNSISGAQGRPDDPAYAALRVLRLNPEGDVQGNYQSALQSAHDFARSNQGPAARSRFNVLYGRLGLGAESYNQLRAMDDPEFSKAQKELLSQSKGTNLSDSTQKSYQETLIHLQGNIDKLGSHFVEVLKAINPSLTRFSDAFTNNLMRFMDGNGKALFAAIGDGLDRFSRYLASPEFLSDMSSLASGISALSKGVVSALKMLGIIPVGDAVPGNDAEGGQQGLQGMQGVQGLQGQQGQQGQQGPKYPPKSDPDWSPKDWIGGLYDDPNRLVAIQKKDQIFKAAAAKYAVSENLIKSIAKEESGGVSSLTSPANAMGVMQLTRATGSLVGLSSANDFSDFFDPAKNIDAGTNVLSRNITENKGDIAKALAQYNGGNYVFREGGDLKKPRDDNNLYLKKETVGYLLKLIKDGNPELEQQHPGLTNRLRAADDMLNRKGNEGQRVKIELTTKQAPGSDTQASISSVRGQAALFQYQNLTVRGSA